MTPAASRRALWALFAVFVLYGGTIPFNFAGDAGALAERWKSLPLSPFISPETGRRLSIPDVVQNILLFLPFGALGVASAGARARWTWGRIARVTAMGAAFSCLIEGLQLVTWDRVASTADVMTNTAGTLAGGVALRVFGRTGEMAVARLRLAGMTGVAELRMLGIATAALGVAYLQPFDVTLEVGGVAGHVRAFQRNPWQFGVLRDEGLMVLLATLFAMTLASYLSAIGEKHAGRKAALLGIVAIVALESAQFFIVSRLPSLWDGSVGLAGLFTGAALWTIPARVDWPALWQGLLALMTAGAAGMLTLSPFEFTSTFHGAGPFSFSTFGGATPPERVGHLIEAVLLFFPLGFCLGLACETRVSALLRVLPLVLLISAPLEYLQGWVDGRYPAAADVALAMVGGLAGVMAARPKSPARSADTHRGLSLDGQ